MKITNQYGLPKTIMNALERDDYSMGNARMSVTGLLKPPQIGLLFNKHHTNIEKDVTDSIWALFGRAVHKILEMGGDEEHVPEERLFAEVKGWRISGQIDLQKLGGKLVRITDYKVTSATAVMNEKMEWVEQLNSYRWLLEESTDMKVDSLSICAFIRDWNRHKAKSIGNYPEAPMVMVPVEMWSLSDAKAFVEERVRLHQEAQAIWDMGGEPPPCTDYERWMRQTKYAVVKVGGSRAKRVFYEQSDALAYAGELGPDYVVNSWPGEPIRCTGDYCNVSRWCKQFIEWKKQNDPT